MDKHDVYEPNAPCIRNRMAKFMEPCLLLLLTKERSYGYELMERLSPFGFEGTPGNMGTMYRTLRQLEDNGMVVSEWKEGSQGPQKRVYELTERGRILLENWASVIRQNRNRLEKFLKVFGSLKQGIRN